MSGHQSLQLVALRRAVDVGLDEVLRRSFNSKRAGTDDGFAGNLLHGDVDRRCDRVLSDLAVGRVFHFELDDKVVAVVLEGDGPEHRDHSRVAVELEIASPLRRILEPETLVRQIPIVRILNINAANLRVRSLTLVVVHKDLAGAGSHWVVVDIADGEEEDADVAQVLEVADLDGDVVALLLFAIKLHFGLQHVAAVVRLINPEPGSRIGVSSAVDFEGERWTVFLSVVVICSQLTDDARVLVFRPDKAVWHVKEGRIVIDVLQDDLEFDETFDAGGPAVLVLGVDVGGPLGVAVRQVSVELLHNPDLAGFLVNAEV